MLSQDTAAMAAGGLNLLLPLTALCLIALLAARTLFGRNPAARYFVCLTGLIGVLLSPLIVGVRNQVGYGLVNLPLPQSLFIPPAPDTAVSPELPVGIGRQLTDAETACYPARGLSREAGVVFSIWALGLVWGIGRFVHGCKAASRIARDARSWAWQEWESRQIGEADAHAGVQEPLQRILGCSSPPVFTSSRVVSPVAIGLFRPMVILPEGLAETLSPTQLRHVLLHEAAHVMLRHTFGGVVERVVGVLFWPHPLIRPLCRELARAREEVCDNVAAQEDGAACYARTLFAIAQGMNTAPEMASTLALLGPETCLEARIAGLLDPRRNRMVRMQRGKLWAVTGIAVCVLAATTVVRVVAAETEAKQDAVGAPDRLAETAAKRRAEAAAQVTAAQAVAQAKLAAQQAVAQARLASAMEAVQRAKAAVRTAQSEMMTAQVHATRTVALAKQGFTAQSAVAQAQATLDQKRALLNQQHAFLAQTQAVVAQTQAQAEIRAAQAAKKKAETQAHGNGPMSFTVTSAVTFWPKMKAETRAHGNGSASRQSKPSTAGASDAERDAAKLEKARRDASAAAHSKPLPPGASDPERDAAKLKLDAEQAQKR
jgi:beta-lactamase regulating signal transducer with metallopeptidase domain